jgi:hypothetical protein
VTARSTPSDPPLRTEVGASPLRMGDTSMELYERDLFDFHVLKRL